MVNIAVISQMLIYSLQESSKLKEADSTKEEEEEVG